MQTNRIALVALSVVVAAADGEQANPEISKTGGTVLTYEIDSDQPPTEGYRPEMLVQALKARCDPYGFRHITIQPVGENRIEIAIPWLRKDHDSVISAIKNLVSTVGRLEFRIVANEKNDGQVFEAARQYFATAVSDTKRRNEIEEAAMKGRPPLAPVAGHSNASETLLGRFTYAWVVLGTSERHTHNLDNAAENDPKRKEVWSKVALARQKGKPILLDDLGLIYSRDCQDQRMPEKQRESKKYEYFVLCRDPEKKKEITGALINSAKAVSDDKRPMAVALRFNAEGGELLHELTSKNLPSGHHGEAPPRLAIILDGQIMIAPQLRSAIRRDVMITGTFTKAQADDLVKILRSGALPVALKPLPVREVTFQPTDAARESSDR
jgi:preprotein translocase subunit SecD